jgi:hypothetical protein
VDRADDAIRLVSRSAEMRTWSTAGSKTGAAINKRWRDDVVGGRMLQLWPGEAAA